MASILRSSKFVRYFSGIARNLVFNTPKEVDGNFVQHSQTLCSGLSQSFATAVPKPDQNLERSLKRLDQDVRRSGRISRRDIEEVMDEIRQHRSATSSQSLLVIRCCGNLVPEELPEVRTTLVQEIWRTLNNLNVSMDVSHYNALLRVYLENEHSFSPTEFLADLEAKGIEPNRVTYQRLISRYCQQGDIDGATRILEFMREKQLPINEHVFNALIMGHCEADDMESAVGILSVMKQAGLEPSADTYTTLLCCYAKGGDIKSILTTLETCEKNEIYLLDKDIFDIIYTLATNGHANTVDELLPSLRKSGGYNQDAVNLILRLTNKGQEDVAFKILKTMPRGTNNLGEPTDTGTFFIKQLVKANRPTEKILKICQELQDQQLNHKAYLVALEAGVTSGSIELAIPFLHEVKRSGLPIRQHYFWPLVCAQAKLGADPMLNVLQTMQSEFNISPNSETVREFVIPNLRERNAEKVIALLRSYGVSTSTSATSMLYTLLVDYKLKEAGRLAATYDVYYQPGLFRRPLIQALVKTKDVDNYVVVVRQIYDSLPKLEAMRRHASTEEDEANQDTESSEFNQSNYNEILGQIVFDVLIHFKQDRVPILTQVLNRLVEQGLSVSSAQAEKIQERLGSELTTEISELLGQLTSGELEPTPENKETRSGSAFSQLSVERLENLISNQEAKGENVKGLKRFLLGAAFKSRDIAKSEEVIARLEAENYVLTTGVYAQLIDLYCQNDNVDKALETYGKIKTKEVDFLLDNIKTIKVANLLIGRGQIDDAVKFFEANRKPELELETEHTFNYNTTCWRVLNHLAEAGKAEDVNRIFETMQKCNYIAPSNILLGPLIKVHIVNNDLNKAVDVFELCCNQYNSTPWKNDLACKLIEAEDAANLQRLTDLSTNIHGEVNSLYDLVFSFVECGRIRQARKILETPGLRSRPHKINIACERYQQEGKVEPLEGLVEATRDLSHIDRGDIYYNLLLSYCKDQQPEKALGLWTKIQEEDITPTDQFLTTLGTYLESNNLEVPFNYRKESVQDQVQTKAPSVATKTTTSVTPSPKPQKTDELSQFKRALRSNDIEAVTVAKQKLTENNKLSLTDNSLYIEMLIRADRITEATKSVLELLSQNLHPLPRIFRFYINRLSSNGDINTMEQIGQLLSSETKKLMSFDNRLCHAYVTASKVDEYLVKLEKDLDNAKTEEELNEVSEKFPRGGAIGILEKFPHLCDQYEKLAEKHASRNIISPMNVLWMHHFVNGNDEAHKKIYNQYLSDVPRLMFSHIAHTARDTKNEGLIRKLIDHVRETKVSEGALGNLYSCLLDVYSAKEEYEQGLVAVQEAIKDVCLENINRTALLRIKDGLAKSNKDFPYKIPEKNTNSNGGKLDSTTSSSSSSSSGSSSDEEPPAKNIIN